MRVGAVRDPNLVARRVCRTRVLTCASPDYSPGTARPETLEELRRHRLIGLLVVLERAAAAVAISAGLARRTLKLPFALSFNAHEAGVSAAIAAWGIVQSMDMMVAKALARGQLVIVLPDWSAEGKHLSIVYPVAQRGSSKVRVFADFAAGLLLQMRQQVDRILAPAI